MATYTVTIRFQYAAHNEQDGIQYEVYGKTKADAIKRARKMAENDGHTGPWVKGKGRATFTATEME